MQCESCKKDDGGCTYMVPLHREDGSLITLMCEGCAMGSAAYCSSHQVVHQGFDDGTTACRQCIEEAVAVGRRNDWPQLLTERLRTGLSEFAFDYLWERAEISALITRSSPEEAILRFIMSKACRLKLEAEEVVSRALRDEGRFILN